MMTTHSPATPTKIDRLSQTEFLISWQTGEQFALSFLETRFQCPCAACVDEHTGRRMLIRENLDSAVRPLGVEVVGRYALQISWSDGHQTGMYAFDRLYRLCEETGRKLPS